LESADGGRWKRRWELLKKKYNTQIVADPRRGERGRDSAEGNNYNFWKKEKNRWLQGTDGQGGRTPLSQQSVKSAETGQREVQGEKIDENKSIEGGKSTRSALGTFSSGRGVTHAPE